MADKRHPHECGFCDATFIKASDHLMHLAKNHRDVGKDSGIKLRRSVSCWRCANEMPPPADETQPYLCVCGFILPTKTQFLSEEEILDLELSKKRDVLGENSRHRSAERILDDGAKAVQRKDRKAASDRH